MTAESSCRAAIDEVYASFLVGLPTSLAVGAERLPRVLGLTTRADASWGELFDVLVLGLPELLLSETAHEVSEEIRGCAMRAHLFAMLAARVTVAVDHGEVEPGPVLDGILCALERERNRALAELRMLGATWSFKYSLPERETRAARVEEREVFEGRAEATLARYLTVSTAKQNLAFPAVMAAAVAAGFGLEELTHVHDIVLGAALGVQIRGDVEAWLTDLSGGASWVEALSGDRAQIEVISEMLELARDAFNKAADSANALGATSLMRWARIESNAIRELLRIADRQLVQATAC